MRNIMDATPKSAKEELYPHLRAILDAPDIGTDRLLLNQTLETFEKKAPKAMQILEMGFDDLCCRKNIAGVCVLQTLSSVLSKRLGAGNELSVFSRTGNRQFA